jgi:hypothetical protein
VIDQSLFLTANEIRAAEEVDHWYVAVVTRALDDPSVTEYSAQAALAAALPYAYRANLQLTVKTNGSDEYLRRRLGQGSATACSARRCHLRHGRRLAHRTPAFGPLVGFPLGLHDLAKRSTAVDPSRTAQTGRMTIVERFGAVVDRSFAGQSKTWSSTAITRGRAQPGRSHLRRHRPPASAGDASLEASPARTG